MARTLDNARTRARTHTDIRQRVGFGFHGYTTMVSTFQRVVYIIHENKKLWLWGEKIHYIAGFVTSNIEKKKKTRPDTRPAEAATVEHGQKK